MKIDEYVEMCLKADPIFFTRKLIILLKFQLMRLIGEIFFERLKRLCNYFLFF